APVAATPSQSVDPPRPLLSVTVTGVLPATEVVFTASDGGGSMVKVAEDGDTPPPGVGWNTETAAVPTAATSAAEMAARSCEALTYVVERFAPFHRTTDDCTKFVPFTVSVNAGLPAGERVGEREVTVGTGLGGVVTVTV